MAVPYTFSAGTLAKSAEVNANFTYVESHTDAITEGAIVASGNATISLAAGIDATYQNLINSSVSGLSSDKGQYEIFFRIAVKQVGGGASPALENPHFKILDGTNTVTIYAPANIGVSSIEFFKFYVGQDYTTNTTGFYSGIKHNAFINGTFTSLNSNWILSPFSFVLEGNKASGGAAASVTIDYWIKEIDY